MIAPPPCPNCGGAATVQPWRGLPVGYEMIEKVRCARCSAQSAPYADASYASEAWNRRAPALRWRREPPDVPGWYWHRSKKNRSPRMRRYSLSARQWFAAHLSQDGHEWAGPLPEPEEAE